MLITLYGVNNIGKSTHAKLLVDRLKKEGYDAIYLKYPIYDQEPSGSYINQILRSGKQNISEEELQLWFTVNRHQFQFTLQSYLDEGKIIVAEDYIATGLTWGAAKGADLEWLKEINKYLIPEDITILMDGERATTAIEDHHIHENNHNLIKKVRQNLLDLAAERDWKIVQLQPTKPETHRLIWKALSPALAKTRG